MCWTPSSAHRAAWCRTVAAVLLLSRRPVVVRPGYRSVDAATAGGARRRGAAVLDRRSAGRWRLAAQWQNTRAPLSTVCVSAAATWLATQAACASTDAERVDLLVAATLARVDAAGSLEEITAALAELVLTDIPVAEIARHVGLSTRQVHRRCLDEFGLAPRCCAVSPVCTGPCDPARAPDGPRSPSWPPTPASPTSHISAERSAP